MIFCAKCGHKMDDSDKFCFNCGTPYEKPIFPGAQFNQGSVSGIPVVQSIPEIVKPEVPVINAPPPSPFPSAADSDSIKPSIITEDLDIVSAADTKENYAVLKYSEGGMEKEFNMTDRILNIGRDPESCELVLSEDRFIGRNHALLYQKNDQYFIVDLNSKNGTFINGERITGLVRLENFSNFKIANTEIEFIASIWE